jgi:hypothetical protein
MNYILNLYNFEHKLEYPNFPEVENDTEIDYFYFEDQKYSYKNLLPNETYFLGCGEIHVDSFWTKWKVDDSYFLIKDPLKISTGRS